MAAGAPSPVEQSERSLMAARAQEMLLLEEEKRRLEASRLRYAAAVPLPPDARSPVPGGKRLMSGHKLISGTLVATSIYVAQPRRCCPMPGLLVMGVFLCTKPSGSFRKYCRI